MDQAGITAAVSAKLGDQALSFTDSFGQQAVTIAPASLLPLLAWLRDTASLRFDMLMDIGGVDYEGYGDDRGWRFEVAYQLYSMHHNHRYRVKVAVHEDALEVPTVNGLFKVANWMEREVFDLFGVRFAGHGNLRRILNHDDFVGHPLRKDYPIRRRQRLTRPVDDLMPDDPEWA